ncbi:hypothetical protein KIM67_10450 [Flagellimonas sp. 389]|uniref:hypothetical protein n=1 Tax=Flagellimonas sp. 389 TaxID=2835862 RepID=UPI001BD39A65|nr:hypothetical protein [Flagellimonas sp. 389]MBS9462833.1 hypothetical protein [Flagellimonas sp. 389]
MMCTSNILREINSFLKQDTNTTLEITFAQLAIEIYHNGHFLKKIERPNSSILLYKPKNNKLAQMDLVDNIAFRFSFWFDTPTSPLKYKSDILRLPQPLTEGFLEMDAEKLIVGFIMHTQGNSIETTHVYTQICMRQRW